MSASRTSTVDFEIESGIEKLRRYMERSEYKGYDPYDALSSPLFRLPFFSTSANIRFAVQQLVKRSPVNLRPLLGIRKNVNPVTLGLSVRGYVNMARAGMMEPDEAGKICHNLVQKLVQLIPAGYSGACWGYDFPWQSRHFRLEAYQPSVVATSIITDALFRLHEFNDDKLSADLCRSSCDFVLNDLNRIKSDGDSFCLSYTPFDHYCVYNAAMKGARVLAQGFALTKDEMLQSASRNIVQYVTQRQNADGSWYYANGEKGRWIDNYHTGYVLECLDEYGKRTQDFSFQHQLDMGLKFYRENFISNNCIPKFYSDKIFPLDCTSASQAIIVLNRFGENDKAKAMAQFMLKEMQSVKGNFYFRKSRLGTIRTPYMRWSDAWMFAALTELFTDVETK